MLFPADPADQSQDEWERWALASPTVVTAKMVSAAGASIIREGFPTIHQMVVDTLSIPAMSTECESLHQHQEPRQPPTMLYQGRPYRSLVGLQNHYAELAGD